MTRLPLGDWSPDSANYWAEGAITIQNALPTKASPNYESQPSIALSAIGPINQSTYNANAFSYSAFSALTASSVTGLTSGKQGTINLWFRVDSSGVILLMTLNGNAISVTPGLQIAIDITGKINISGANAALANILTMKTSQTFSPSSTWHNLLASWDLAAGLTNLFIDGISDNVTTVKTNDTLAYVGSNTYQMNDFGGLWSQSECWFDNSYFDLTSGSNRAKFISGGFPIGLGSTGQTPTGSSPKIYFNSAAGSAGVNKGTGGNWTIVPTISNASSSPSTGAPSPTNSQILGGASFIDSSGSPHTYVGTSAQLAEITNINANNISKAGGYTCNTYWKFASLNGTVFATDYTDNVQSMTIGGTVFADLAGSPPKGQCIAQWGQQIVLGHTNGGTYGGGTAGAVPNRIWGCAIGVPTSWPDPLTNAGQASQAFVQDLNANYGDLVHMTNGVFMALAFQQTGITRALYQGAPTVWSFDDFEKKIGLYCPNSVVQIEESKWAFISSAGFYMTDGYSVTPIGHNMVDNTFLADLNTAYLSHVRGSFDPVTKLIKWVYPSLTMTLQGGFPVCDKMIAYNYVDHRWGMAMVGQNIDMVFPSLTLGYTMEQLDSVNSNLDLITPSLDDPYWNGGVPTVGVFGIQQIGTSGSYASYWGSFSGTALTATLDTKVINANPGGLSFSSEYKAIVMGTFPTIQGYVGTQSLLTDSVTWIGPGTQEARTGKISQRSNAVYKRYRLVISNGFTNALGVETEEKAAGSA